MLDDRLVLLETHEPYTCISPYLPDSTLNMSVN